MNSWHVAVLIPARNEEELLPRCLQSVIDACSALPADITTDVIVVSDRSTDQTLKVATQLLGDRGVAFEVGFSCVGMARLVAAAVALRRCQSPPKWCWLANTDADCEVPPDWLADQLLFANKGAAAVAGTIAVDSFTEHQPQVAELFREAYLIHADGTHPHVHGANLGIRADAYLDAGGWAKLKTAEDHDLWNRLGMLGHTRISNARLQVLTSGRRSGRAPLGFAATLASFNGLRSQPG